MSGLVPYPIGKNPYPAGGALRSCRQAAEPASLARHHRVANGVLDSPCLSTYGRLDTLPEFVIRGANYAPKVLATAVTCVPLLDTSDGRLFQPDDHRH